MLLYVYCEQGWDCGWAQSTFTERSDVVWFDRLVQGRSKHVVSDALDQCSYTLVDNSGGDINEMLVFR